MKQLLTWLAVLPFLSGCMCEERPRIQLDNRDRLWCNCEVTFPGGVTLGWSRQSDGCLALVGDLQRLSRSRSLQGLLGRLTRAYAARMALRDAALHFAEAQVSVST